MNRDDLMPMSVTAVIDKLAASRLALLVVLPSLLGGCATSPEARVAQVQRHAQQAAAVLAKRTDADSLAAAGLLSLESMRDQSMALLTRATQAAPERPELVWLQAESCQRLPSCDPEPMERRLRTLDPSNGASWMGALARANASKDLVAVDAALVALSQSERVDIYYTTLLARLSRAAGQSGKISLPEAQILVIGYLSAQAIPAYGPASNACKGDRLQRPDILEVCRGVAKAFERGDTYITEMIGVAITKRVWPEGSPEWRAAVEARSVYEYRSKLWSQLETNEMYGQPEAERYLALCDKNPREQDVLMAQLVAAGRNPNPPPQGSR
jgi:hypothetical protein